MRLHMRLGTACRAWVTVGMLVGASMMSAQAAAAPPPAGGKVRFDAPKPAARGGVEVPALRTERSRTVRLADGSYQLQISGSPISFRDGSGRWRAIDNDLVSKQNGTLTNAAGAVDVEIPQNASGDVSVASGTHSLSFGLAGSSPAAGVRADGSEAVFEDVLPRVDATYEAVGSGVKETLTLAAAGTPRSYVFDVEAPGLTPRLEESGEVTFRDGGGTTRFAFAAPWMQDAAGEVSRAARYELRESGSGQQVVLRLDDGWLSAPQRRFPVAVDPTVITPQGWCEIASGTAANSYRCAASMPVWVGRESGRVHRALIGLGDLSETVWREDLVLRASLHAWVLGQSIDEPADLDVHHLTRGFSNRATWNRSDGRALWATAGGEFNPVREVRRTITPADVESAVHFDITELAQRMVQGDEPSQNLMLKAANETAAHHEVLENFQVHVTYKPRTGLSPMYTYDQWPLSDGSTLSQNVGNANFVIARDDLDFDGDDGRFTVGRFYNSESRYDFAGTFGNGTHGDFGSITLERNPLDGSYVYTGPSGLNGVFHKKLDGTFTAPPGANAVLAENGDGTITLTFADTGEIWTFAPEGSTHHLVRSRGRYGYQVDATYVPGWGGRIATLSDSQGNRATFEHDMAGDMTTITDQNSAVHRYEYDDHTLTAYVAPNGDWTTYTYGADRKLTRISLPDRRALKLDYWPGNSYVRWVTPVDAAGVDQPATEYDGGPGYTTAQRPGVERIAWFYDTRLAVDLIQHGRAPALSVNGVIPSKNGTYDRAIAPYTADISSADDPDGVRQLVLEFNGEPVDSIAGDCSSHCPQRLRGSLTFDAGAEPDGAHSFQVRSARSMTISTPAIPTDTPSTSTAQRRCRRAACCFSASTRTRPRTGI